MSKIIRGAVQGVTLRAAEGPNDADHYILLPSLSELLGRPGFGARNAILLPGTDTPLDGWALFGLPGARDLAWH